MKALKMDKRAKTILAVYAIILVVYILFFALIPFRKIAATWISFVFTLIAAMASLGITVYAFAGQETLQSKVYGFPVFRIGYLYAGLQFGLGLLIILVSAFVNTPYWVALLVGVALAAFAAIGVIATDNVREEVQVLEEEEVRVTRAVKTFRLDIASVVDVCASPECKPELEKLAEAIRFSDPVSSEATEAIEAQLSQELQSLKLLAAAGQGEALKKAVARVSNMLAERNRICKANK